MAKIENVLAAFTVESAESLKGQHTKKVAAKNHEDLINHLNKHYPNHKIIDHGFINHGYGKHIDGWGNHFESHEVTMAPKKGGKNFTHVEMDHSGTGWHGKLTHGHKGTDFTTYSQHPKLEGAVKELATKHKRIYTGLKNLSNKG